MCSHKSGNNVGISKTVFLLVCICLLGAALRLHGIGDRSFWLDEAFSWTMATQYSVGEIFYRSANDFNPPLYYIVLKIWIFAFGDTEVSQRGLSAVFAVATIVAVYLLCRDAFTKVELSKDALEKSSRSEVGLVAAALVAVCPAHLQWSVETRMYTQTTFLAVLSTWLLFHCIETKSRSLTWKMLYSFSAIALLYTHTFGVFTVFAQACFVFVLLLSQWYSKSVSGITELEHIEENSLHAAIPAKSVSANGATTVRQFCGLYVFIGIACAPWGYVLLTQAQRAKSEYWIQPMNAWTLPNIWAQLIGPSNHLPQFMNRQFTTLVVLGSSVTFIIFLMRTRTVGERLVATMLLSPVIGASIVSLLVVPILDPKHLLISLMFFICVASYVISTLKLQSLRTGIVLLLMTDCLYLHFRYLVELDVESRPGIRMITEHIRSNFRDGDAVIVKNPAMLFSTRYYFRDRDFNPMLLRNSAIASYSGAALIDESDQIGSHDLIEMDALRVWEIDTTGFAQTPVGSFEKLHREHWSIQSTVAQQGVLHFEGAVILRLYDRASSIDP